MITAADNPLVAGGALGAQKSLRVKVTRPFLLRTERVEVGTVLELPRPLAAELISTNKCERTNDPLPVEKAKAPTPKPDAAPPKAPAEAKKES